MRFASKQAKKTPAAKESRRRLSRGRSFSGTDQDVGLLGTSIQPALRS